MQLYTINTGFFKLDGGAMFGVVPKTLWSKVQPADENNLRTWAMRCLLIEDGGKLPIQESGQLHFVDTHGAPIPISAAAHVSPGATSGPAAFSANAILPGLSVRLVEGHTAAMMLPQLSYKGHTLVFVADLLPSVSHFPMAWTMAYDVFPLTSMVEKRAFLDEAAAGGYVLFFEHDPLFECCIPEATEKGVRAGKGFRLGEI